MTLEIDVDLTARMMEHLLAGRRDMVFLAGPVAHPAIQTTSIGSLALVWLASSDPPLDRRIDHPRTVWSLPPHSPIHHIVREEMERQSIQCRTLNSCNNVRTLIDIVAQGSGIGLFPETMVRKEVQSGRLVEVLPRPKRRIEFQSAIRRSESDPLILQLTRHTVGLDVDPLR